MKKTRKIFIESKVFALGDLKKIAEVFEKQQQLAQKADHNYRIEYSINFSNDTSIESDSTNILNEDTLRCPGRPIQVAFSFHNYTLCRHISFLLSHGDSRYKFNNQIEIRSSEDKWINDNFVLLKDAIDAVRPQEFWFRKHPTIGLHLIALGVGTFLQLLMQIIMNTILDYFSMESLVEKMSPNSEWRTVIRKAIPLLYLLLWNFRWLIGLTWAFDIRSWLLRLWPNIEFDFGSEHLKIEQKQRARLIVVLTLVIVPLILSFLYDFVVML